MEEPPMKRPTLGPAAEAERARQMIRAQGTATRRPTAEQESVAGLALFAPIVAPGLL
jgi:hypothetical protein